MVVFIVLFYIFMIQMDRNEKKYDKTTVGETSASIVSAKEIRAKEDLFKKNIQNHPFLVSGMTLLFFLVVFEGLFIDIYLLNKRIKGAPLVSGGLTHESVPWGLKEVAQVFMFLFFVETLILLIEWAFLTLSGSSFSEKDLILMLNSLIRDISAAALVIFFVTKRFGRPCQTIGLTTQNFFKNVKIGLLGYLAIIPAILMVLIILSAVAKKLCYEPPVQAVVQIYLKEMGRNALLFFTLFVTIVGPMIEEVFFRGFTYKAFRQRWGVRWALVASSGIFAGLHLSLIGFFPIFLLGLFLAYLYEITGSLVPSMTAHMIHNLIMVSLTLVFKNYSS